MESRGLNSFTLLEGKESSVGFSFSHFFHGSCCISTQNIKSLPGDVQPSNSR